MSKNLEARTAKNLFIDDQPTLQMLTVSLLACLSFTTEELAVVAGITVILSFAIEPSKVIWETLKGMKEAPADVEPFITVVSNLRLLLEQLEDLWKKNDRDGGTLSKDLEAVITTCAFDLDQFRKEICTLQASPDVKTWRRTWRTLKFVFQKEKLHSMRIVTMQHHSALKST